MSYEVSCRAGSLLGQIPSEKRLSPDVYNMNTHASVDLKKRRMRKR